MVPTSESLKVMGLMGIHNPDALWCYAGYTYCPWCGKEGQNEGTVVNHLRTTHYRLGLMCNQCFGCPSVMADSLCWHGCQDCQQYGVPSSPSDWPTLQTEGWYQGAEAVLSSLRKAEGFDKDTTCQSALLTKQLLPSQLWPDLFRNDMTNNVKHTHPNWLQPGWCLQEFIETTRSNNISTVE